MCVRERGGGGSFFFKGGDKARREERQALGSRDPPTRTPARTDRHNRTDERKRGTTNTKPEVGVTPTRGGSLAACLFGCVVGSSRSTR
jgi:hypothetical protein